ncbi:GNAT family N-acetyltransferase [Prauserella muralis]|uniref:GCN5 family acetyltransferase n=1 Tax=Prauserella muralis TaxID=588067 RepID=A0A2V4BAT9_9PSEU|nr:GNAT family N-acetyltransferase [Prauserella muralis]PXY32408.1 GCN5 family acetyltransferase [Prauserella muralis]TWE23903.1 acetyltransferase (GNAT) family protein [Prauserella muralis]
MDPAEEIEQACADAWPAQTEQPLGGWRLRASVDTVARSASVAGGGGRRVGFTGRANSVLAVGDPGVPVAEALTRACEFAHAHGVPPMVQAVKDGRVERELAGQGWRPYVEYENGHEVAVLLGAVPAGPAPEKTAVLGAPTAGWWELAVGRPEPAPAERHVLTSGAKVGFGVAELDGVTAGGVRGSVVGETLLVARLAVRPGYRRRGLATALMAAIGDWGRRRGATRCVLQVSVGNTGALALYAGLGFTEHHRYRYWVP